MNQRDRLFFGDFHPFGNGKCLDFRLSDPVMVCQIPRDSVKTAGQFFYVPQFVELFPDAQKRFQSDVLAFMKIAENAVNNSTDGFPGYGWAIRPKESRSPVQLFSINTVYGACILYPSYSSSESWNNLRLSKSVRNEAESIQEKSEKPRAFHHCAPGYHSQKQGLAGYDVRGCHLQFFFMIWSVCVPNT